ncbi:hypothetical protein DCC24_10220 [Auritidibacter sp. NML100628]|nr:hypothetical protein DCC24_10220 [Auritidibacter sp. NML100628]
MLSKLGVQSAPSTTHSITKTTTRDQIRIMSKRPGFTIAQITEQFDVSRSTVRRGLNNSRFFIDKPERQ